MRILNESPRITWHAGVVTAVQAADLVGLVLPRLGEARVSGDTAGEPSGGRRCETAWLPHHADPLVAGAVAAMGAAAGHDPSLAEQLQVIRYVEGGEYRPHFDSYDPTTERGARCTAGRGQRTHTALLYLSDDVVGGATTFPALDLSVRPRTGTMVCFENCEPGTNRRDRRSLHAGAPVERGEKWVATLWFRSRVP